MNQFPRARFLLTAVALAAAGAANAQYTKLDAGLSDLVDAPRIQAASQAKAQAKAKARARLGAAATTADAETEMQSTLAADAITDDAGRILVDIYLDGSTSIDDFVAQLQAAGASVTGVNPDFRFGAVSAFVPAAAVTSIASGGGLNLMRLTGKPQTNVGAVNSQGAKVMKTDVANAAGYTGAGITVGVLSDSYDGSPTTFTTIRAATDIASGDLRTPKFVIDLPTSTSNTDEGRAMMQIVQDVAPQADLCFATAFAGEASFAANIRTLRTNPACAADVIVDDVFYFDEPFYSDGQVAQAVNDVANSTTLPGKKVSYFSSAGNQGSAGGYGSVDVPNATFTTAPTGLGNINLASAATCTSSPSTGSTKANVAGGWLNWPSGGNALTVTYTSSSSRLIMQWDDLFYQGKATTDLNFYLFNAAGACVFTFASNNLSTDAGIEVASLSGGTSGTYRIMVGRTSTGTNKATRVRLVSLGGWGGTPFQTRNSPTTFGHSAAAGANSVAAYRYTSPATQTTPFIPAFESFSSPGPVTIAFDSIGNRLAVPETRKKPDIAAPDGGDTTFFYPGQDFEGNGRPNFFGTSAAAPHAAGVAALMLQKAGGPGSLTPKQVKSVLQASTAARAIPFSGSSALVKGWSAFDGFGLIDAGIALSKLP